MTDDEAIGKAVTEKKRREQELKTLRIKADQHGERFALLAHLLKTDPAGAVFESQATRRRFDTVASFSVAEFDGAEIKELVGKIREHEDRLADLKAQLE